MIRLRVIAQYALLYLNSYLYLDKKQKYLKKKQEYIANSLKATTRSKRGQGARRRIQPSSQIPRNWQQFLRSKENKQ